MATYFGLTTTVRTFFKCYRFELAFKNLELGNKNVNIFPRSALVNKEREDSINKRREIEVSENIMDYKTLWNLL